MNRNVLSYLEQSTEKFPNKCAVADADNSFTYQQLLEKSSSIGTALSGLINVGEAVGIYMEKNAETVAAFLGTAYAGGFYSVLNNELSKRRLLQKGSVLKPKVFVTSRSLL